MTAGLSKYYRESADMPVTDPERVAVIGDIHMNVNWAVQVVGWARTHRADVIVQVGDFGYRNAGQCSGLQAGGEGPRGRAARPERAVTRPRNWRVSVTGS